MEPGGLWDADKINVEAEIFHNQNRIAVCPMEYAGRTNVFRTEFQIPEVKKDYEVLGIVVTASQPLTWNFGAHQRTVKLIP